MVVAAACALWVGLAVPGLELLPGVAAPSTSNAAISLQSAILGIDDDGSTHDGATLRVLGITTTLSRDLLRRAASPIAVASSVELDARARALAVTQPAASPSPATFAIADAPQPVDNAAPAEVAQVDAPPAPEPAAVRHATPQPHTTTPPPAPPSTPPSAPVPPRTAPAPVLQAISFTTTPSPDAGVGDTYAVNAVATSGLPVTLTIDSPSVGVCSIHGNAVSFDAPGRCMIDADQRGDASFRPAPQVQQSVTIASRVRVLASVQSIAFTSTPPSTAVLGNTYTVSAVASSGLPVVFSVDAASFGVCSVAGTTVTFEGKGTCTIIAQQDGDDAYTAAPTALQSFDVHRKPQTIAFSTTPPSSATVGGAAYAIAATASSGLAVVFSADPTSAGVCSVVGAVVTPIGAGACIVDADQFGSATFQAGPQVQQSFAVGSAAPSQSIQSITFTSVAPAAAVVGGAYAVSAAGSSGLPVSFSADPFSAGVCTVSGSTVTFDAAGTCLVDADQGGDASYLAAPQVQQSFVIGRATQAISFTSPPPVSATVGGANATVAAQSTAGLAVTFTADASSAGVCTVSGSTVSMVGVGTCVVDADQAGDATHAPAARVQQSFAVAAPSKSVQSITFTSPPPASATAGASSVASATASSGQAVIFSAGAGSAGVCTVSGSTITFVGAGTCRVDADQPGNASYDAAPTATQSFTVSLRGQTIAFTSSPPAAAVAGGVAYVVTAAAGSGLAVTFSTASSAGVCTVSGSTVTFVAAGTCTVDADQPGDASYAAAPRAQQSFFVAGASKSTQTIAFTSTAPTSAAIGDAYAVAATASSGLAVSLTVDAASAAVCSIAGATVSFTGSGTCTIDGNQAGDASYQPAPQQQQSIAVGVTPQTISFTSSSPGSVAVGDPAYVVAAVASSGLPVTYSADASSAGICTVSGSSVTFDAPGTCTVDADQAGDATHAAAPRAQQSFAVGGPPVKSVQSITFTSSAPAGAVVGGSTTVTAAASSGLAVSFSSGATGACTVSGSTVSFVGAGTCTVAADQAGDASYQAAPQVQQSFTVALRTQTIAFTSAPPSGAIAGGATYAVGATASSGLAVSFTSASTSVCTVSGTTVSFVGGGTCTLRADQGGDATYQPASQVQQSFAVAPATPSKSVQSITLTSTPPSSPAVGGTYVVAATASSGLAVSFTVVGSAGVCSVSGATVSLTGSGTCTVAADQAGNASYQAAPQVQQSFAVGLQSQTIAFSSSPPARAVAGGATYAVAATASSGLGVTFSSGSPAVCTVAGSTVSFAAAGTCVVNADQSGNGTYAAAARAQQSFTVFASAPPKSSQTIAFTSTPPANAAIGGSYAASATASSGLAVTLTADASSSGICTVAGTTVSFVGRGTCTVDANQAGNGSYLAAPQVQQSFSVGGTTQTVSYTSSAPTSAAVGGSTYTLAAAATSGLPVSFSIDASSGGVCTLSGSKVTMVHVGTCTVDADQPGNATYAAAPRAQQSFTIGRGSQTITFTSTPPDPVGGNSPAYAVSATSGSGLAVTFTTDPSSSGVCAVSGSTVSFQGSGVCVIYANQAGSSDWLAAPQATQYFFVKHHVGNGASP